MTKYIVSLKNSFFRFSLLNGGVELVCGRGYASDWSENSEKEEN